MWKREHSVFTVVVLKENTDIEFIRMYVYIKCHQIQLTKCVDFRVFVSFRFVLCSNIKPRRTGYFRLQGRVLLGSQLIVDSMITSVTSAKAITVIHQTFTYQNWIREIVFLPIIIKQHLKSDNNNNNNYNTNTNNNYNNTVLIRSLKRKY